MVLCGRESQGPCPLARSALSFRKNHHLDRALTAVSLRHGGDRDVTIRFDFRQRYLDGNRDTRVIGKLDRQIGAVARLYGQHSPIDSLDRAAHAHRRWLLLGKACGCDEQQGKAGQPENAACDLVHVVLPKSGHRRNTTRRNEQL
jgi:hypothetical protein